jgi:hypothetical protein
MLVVCAAASRSVEQAVHELLQPGVLPHHDDGISS